MSQVAISRPATQTMGRTIPQLPEIQHPLSRMSNPDTMLVGRVGGSGRPLTAEQTYPTRRPRTTLNGRSASRTSQQASERNVMTYEAIPEGVEVQVGDPAKTRLPVFGNKRELTSREELATGNGRPSSRLSTASAQARLEIDQLESILRDKMKNNFHEIKKTFKNNDPENKGNLSRDALHRVLVTVLGLPVTHAQYQRLMERLGFRERTVVNFPEFFALFMPSDPATQHQRWMDPVHRQVHEKVLTSAIVNMYLRERAQKSEKLSDLIPGLAGSRRIVRPEFRDTLDKMGFPMDDAEFEKLWAKYDSDGLGSIDLAALWNKLVPEKAVENGSPGSRRSPKKKEIERQRSLDIEKWLKKKFREGFSSMKSSLEEKDPSKSGQINHQDFMQVLSQFGLNLDMDNLALFLARCSVQPTRTHVPYREFLHRFQDRSEEGMAHKVLTNQGHRYNRPGSPGAKSTMSSIEVQLVNMFQRDFLSLLGTFHKIDRLGLDFISQEEFRAAIESKFDMELTDAQFRSFIDQVPLDPEGNVLYADFMAQFDTKGKAKSLFAQDASKSYPKPIGALPRDLSPGGGALDTIVEEYPPGGQVDRLVVDDVYAEPRDQRSVKEIFKIIKELLQKDYQLVEETFLDIDELNSGRISQEMMYKLLKRLEVKPKVTRGEIRNVWKTLITNQDRTLEYFEFTRHFGHSRKSATFPNAKVSPPKRGDSDFRMRSRKLNCASDMLLDGLRSKIDYMWDELHKEFTAIDPYDTGCVNADEFRDILKELCVYLTNYEMEMLTQQFTTVDEGRVSYVEFLKPFALKRQLWKTGNNMTQLLQHNNAKKQMKQTEASQAECIHDQLREQLFSEWRTLKRAFKKLDNDNSGSVALADFRSILKLMRVTLTEEQVYDLMSHYDSDLTGKLNYNRFLNETLKAPSTSAGRQTPLRKSAQL